MFLLLNDSAIVSISCTLKCHICAALYLPLLLRSSGSETMETYALVFRHVDVFGASTSNVEFCYSFNIHTRVLIFGMGALSGSNIGVVELKWNFFFVIARLFEEHGELLQYPWRQRKRENVKVFVASNVEACHLFNIYTRVLIFCTYVLYGSNIGVVESNWKKYFVPSNLHLFRT